MTCTFCSIPPSGSPLAAGVRGSAAAAGASTAAACAWVPAAAACAWVPAATGGGGVPPCAPVTAGLAAREACVKKQNSV